MTTKEVRKMLNEMKSAFGGNIKKLAISLSAGTIILATVAMPVSAASSLFGDASIVGGGNPGNAASLPSDTSLPNGFSGVSFDDTNGMFISELTTLSTDFNVTDDDCFGGSPRFEIIVDADNDNLISAGDKTIFVYPDPYPPSILGCTPNTWLLSGNLVTDPDPRWDASPVGGTFYDTYANASTLTATNEILRISLVVDSSWGFPDSEQTILVDNVNINGISYDFTLPPDPFVIPAECSDIEGLGTPIMGTDGSDSINGTPNNDLIFALGGSDKVTGNGGDDCIVGGDGSDKLLGNNGNDVILGGDGADSILGNSGQDSLYGQGGADTLRGGNQADTLIGGAGIDSAKGEAGNSDVCDAESESSCEL